jgi:hypothetical protein
MIAGSVSSDGEVTAGFGFALTRTGPGVYAIRFIEPFADTPVVVATPADAGRTIAAIGTTIGAEVTLTDLSDKRADGGFAFAVMAPGARAT